MRGHRKRSARQPSSPLAIDAGRPWPLGATVDADARGVNFAVFSAHAERVELCLFDAAGRTETARVDLPGRSGDVWHGHLPSYGAGTVYGFRAYGPWAPEEGHRFDPARLLLDPYAREIVGRWSADAAGHAPAASAQVGAARPATLDNGPAALKARVVAEARAEHPRVVPPNTPLADSVLYEVHVKGFSAANPRVPEPLRGTYAGLAHPASIGHLKQLGITAVSLLPVQQRLDEPRLTALGLTNYWGYNTIGFFAPEPQLSADPGHGAAQRREFRAMVDALHAAGIEVILDVVYNHTAEGELGGPVVAFRGLDNASYYRRAPDGADANWSGCGNTVDLRHPRVLQLVMDSLRYWVGEMGVDGFRFDLAPVLGRGDTGFSPRAAFFMAVAQDPVLARVKLIAEPWDLGPDGYQAGAFPNGWGEWNDKFRDDLRAFWLRHPSSRGALARRLCGSSDIYQTRGRAPAESINYVVSHDGFTLRDLVSYAERHNAANGEGNRDGTANNLSYNAGAEGPSDDPTVLRLRARLQRALLATTLLAQGTPMLAAGDELGHTQHGNNNPYCQDNPTTWIDWASADADLIAFTARVVALRVAARPFGAAWYSGLVDPLGLHDLVWFDATGVPLEGNAWNAADDRCFACLIGEPGRAAAPLLLLFNGGADDHDMRLPGGVWQLLLDTSRPRGDGDWHGQGDSKLTVPGAALLLLAAAGAEVRLPDAPLHP